MPNHTQRHGKGTLIIVGGHEDREGERVILRTIAAQVDASDALVVATVASGKAREQWEEYEPIFRRLGVRHVRHFHIDTRDEALSGKGLRQFDDASAVFLTGGDQLKLTSQLGDTPVFSRLREIYERGGCIAGTSAGASVVCETMLVSGGASSSPRIDETAKMAPGFGLIPGIIVDQHFAERGRMGRLIGAVAQNPRILGIGIDENTAIYCHKHRNFTVIGEGGVYVVDASRASQSNVAEGELHQTLSVFDLKVHLLNAGDVFDLHERRPQTGAAEEAMVRVGAPSDDGR